MDPAEGAIGWRVNKAGRRVQVDSTGSEIRRGSRRPIGRVSSDDWKKLTEDQKDEWGRKLKGERDLAKKFGFKSRTGDDAFVADDPREALASEDDAADAESTTPFDRPDPPMEVPKGRARMHADVASKRRSKKKAAVDSGAPPGALVPEDEEPVIDPLAAPPPVSSTSSGDPLGSSEARGKRSGKLDTLAMGIFAAVPQK